MKEIRLFGSSTRNENDEYSDIDILVITDIQNFNADESIPNASVYSPEAIKKLWEIGDPFAWHLFKESKLIKTDQRSSFLDDLGHPTKYGNFYSDIENYEIVCKDSMQSFISSDYSTIFDAAGIFVSIRNAAIAFSLTGKVMPTFSRDAALRISEYSIDVSKSVYSILKSSRLSSTRGKPIRITRADKNETTNEFPKIIEWMSSLKENAHE